MAERVGFASFALRASAGSHPVCNAILRVSSVRWLAEPKLTEGERRMAERVGFVPDEPATLNGLGAIGTARNRQIH